MCAAGMLQELEHCGMCAGGCAARRRVRPAQQRRLLPARAGHMQQVAHLDQGRCAAAHLALTVLHTYLLAHVVVPIAGSWKHHGWVLRGRRETIGHMLRARISSLRAAGGAGCGQGRVAAPQAARHSCLSDSREHNLSSFRCRAVRGDSAALAVAVPAAQHAGGAHVDDTSTHQTEQAAKTAVETPVVACGIPSGKFCTKVPPPKVRDLAPPAAEGRRRRPAGGRENVKISH